MSEWKETELGQLAKFNNGRSSPERVDSGKHPVYGSNGIIGFSDYYNSDEGTIIIGRVGSYCGSIYYFPEKCWITDNAIVGKGKRNTDTKYLFYLMHNLQLNKHKGGSGQPLLNQSILNRIEVLVPKKVSEQKKIANILTILDNKIDLLRRQNETLEAIAQTLFKRWFVEFEFPNKESQPYKSSGGKMVSSELGEIPEGWRVGKLEEHVIIINGYSYKSSELVESSKALVTLKNFDRNGGFKLDGFKKFQGNYKKQQIVEEGDLVVAHTDLTQKAEVLGNPALIISPMKYEKLVISMDLVKVKPKDEHISKTFLYFLMRERKFKYHCKGYANGTTVLHLSKNAIPEYLCCLPTDNFKIIRELSNILENIVNKISLNTNQICIFTQTRDALLPKLMSGQIRVK